MKKATIVRIVCGVVAAIIVAVLIVGNILLNTYQYIIHQVFAGDTTDYDDAKEELASGDEVVQKLGEESIVLLKNEDDFLPLGDDAQVNLFGWAATDQGFIVVGGGSGGTVIAEENKVTLTQAFKKAEFPYNEELLADFSAISSTDADANSNSPNSLTALTNPAANWYDANRMNKAYSYSHTAVVVFSRFSGENASQNELIEIQGSKYTGGTYLELTDEERAMLDALQQYNFDVVVLFNTTNNMEMGFLEEYPNIKAALQIGVLGQSGALAIPKILRGDVNPSGRLADTLAYDYQTHNPSYVNGMYVNNSMAYQEGIYVGYKWYETADEVGYFEDQGTTYEDVVQFPFGYGLSYTDFVWEVETPSWDGDDMDADTEYSITVNVTNNGDVAGKDVVQLYLTPPYTEGGIEKASKNLIAFAKTEEIPAGGTRSVTLTFDAYDLASYDCYDANKNGFSGWEAESGDYYLSILKNAHDNPTTTGGSNVLSLYSNGIEWPNDPDTGNAVVNRFTGDTAYADMPIDGSAAIAGGVDYLSRANAFSNMPRVRVGDADDHGAGTYTYDGYNDEDVSDIKYGEDSGMYLVMVDSGEVDEEGNPILVRATLDQLTGADSEVTLVANEELMEKLADYNNDADWNTFLNQLTEQEVKDLIGKGGFQTEAAYSVGKPRSVDRDGPAGFNMGVTNPNANTMWTGFPTESTIACSWNTQLMYEMGAAQGKVATATGLQGWYAPGVNLHRSVYNTRNYEYFSEDATLTADMAAQIVKGAKDNNLYCYVKHFAVSEAGANPNNKMTWLTEQALREIYFKPFEECVKEGGTVGIMSAFNRVGGVWAGANKALLMDVLRGEWDFHGTVITDWYQSYYMGYEFGLKGGNDLWLDGASNSSANINLNDAGTAYAARRAVKNILYTYVATITDITVTAAPHSALFSALWVVLNVVLGLGLATCALFIVKPVWKKKTEISKAE